MKHTLRYVGIFLLVAIMASVIALLGISASAAATAPYVDANGESQIRTDVTELTGSISSPTLSSGWYLLRDTVTGGVLTCSGDVHLILADGAVITVSSIYVPYGSSVTIYGQQQQTGKLTTTTTLDSGIGGSYNNRTAGCGDITINGGIIEAKGGKSGAGIGAATDTTENKVGNITINGGKITATSVPPSPYHGTEPAIGTRVGSVNCTITINGGEITAETGIYYDTRAFAAGIGSGGTIKGIVINGGTLDVFGDCVGIGGISTPVTINGGNIKVVSNKSSAGIGAPSLEPSGPITITGGYIDVTSNKSTAIGAGTGDSPEAPITISGGTVIANGAGYGIGGNTSSGGNKAFDLILTGGSIYAHSDGDTSKAFSPKAQLKNALGETVTLTRKELTLKNAGDGVVITAVAGSSHGVKDVQTVDDKVWLYLSDASALPTKIYTDKGLYLPESSGSTTYVLHASHTASPTYTPNADDTEQHDKLYPCCDELTVEAHLFSEGVHTCPCGETASARIGTHYFVDFDVALRYARDNDGSEIVLLSDAGIEDNIHFDGNLILDLNGFALITSDKYTYAINLRSGSLELKDSSAEGSGSVLANSTGSDTVGVETGTLTLRGGTYGKIAVENGQTVTVRGGTVRELTVDGGTLSVLGGSFGKLTAPVALQTTLGTDMYFYNAQGEIVDASALSTLEQVEVKAGADLAHSEAVLEYTEIDYTALANEPTLTLSVFGSSVAAEHFDIVYADNTLPGQASVTVRGKGIYSGEKTFHFVINRGTLTVSENPTATHQFGDIYSDKAITGGKVVIVGNSEAVITGTWTWVEGAPKATFTPDESYEGLFETLQAEIDVTVEVTAADPIYSITAPSASLIPGVVTNVTVSVRNPHDAELTDLPTAYRIVYRIGEEGADVTVDGLTFSLVSTAAMGETVYLRVENVAVDGKYTSVRSTNTLELTVGFVDATAEIEQAKEELNAAILELEQALENGQTSVETLTDAVTNLQARMRTAEELLTAQSGAASQSEVNALKTALEKADSDLDSLVKQVAGDLAAAKGEVTALKTALEQADSDMAATIAQLTAELTAAKTELGTAKADLNTRLAALEASDGEAEEPASAGGAAVAAIVIAAVSVCGNLALGAYLFLRRKQGV